MVVWFLITASLAVGLAVLYARKRRQERAVHEFSDQLLRLTRDAGATGRIGVCIPHNLVGLMNGSMGVYNAFGDHAPVMVLGAACAAAKGNAAAASSRNW